MERRERLYRFEPLDTSGVFLGLGIVQSALIGGAVVVAVVALSVDLPLVVAAAPVVVAATLSFARLRGQPAWEWLWLMGQWLWMRAGRGARWFAPLPLVGEHTGEATPMPPCLEGLTVVEVPWREQRPIAAIRDAHEGTLTAVVPVAGPPFLLAERDEQERVIGQWSDTLNQFAIDNGPVSHIAWSDLARPSGLQPHVTWLHAHNDGGDRPERAVASYEDLLAGAADEAMTHEVLVTVTVDESRLGRPGAGDDRQRRLTRSLVSSLDALHRSLRAGGLTAGAPLSVPQMWRLVRTRSDPHAERPQLVDGRLTERLGFDDPATSTPLAVETGWRDVRVDAGWHRTYWIASWPRLAVPPSWLEPFLSASGVTRALTVVFCPVSRRQSRRRIERDLVKLDSDAVTKEDKGRRVDARHQRATEALLEREQELVAGYAEMEYLGLVTVSARTRDELDTDSEAIEQLAAEAGMELRALDGRQDLAWAAALPLGLAPKTLLG